MANRYMSRCSSWRIIAATAKSLQLCPTLCDPIDGNPPGSAIPGILQAKNTGVGCHFLLRCMKVKSESDVAQSCPTLSDPMDCSLPGSSVHGILQARVLEWGAIPPCTVTGETAVPCPQPYSKKLLMPEASLGPDLGFKPTFH